MNLTAKIAELATKKETEKAANRMRFLEVRVADLKVAFNETWVLINKRTRLGFDDSDARVQMLMDFADEFSDSCLLYCEELAKLIELHT